MLTKARARSSRHPLAAARDGGYVIAMTAMLMLPLMAFTGLAVDLGAWYARAAQIQRTTDAAALAGVAFLPIPDGDPIAASLAVAEENGFKDGEDGIEVTAEPLVGDRMRVTITDNSVPQYFTRVFRSSVSITRSSTAEYVPPIRMGSPRNFLGTGRAPTVSTSDAGLPSSMIRENFMLSVNGPCDRAEDGDLRQSERMGNNSSSNKCTGGDANPEYESTGYAYGITVNAGYSAGNLVVEVYDGAYCPGNGIDLQLGSARFDTRYTLRGPAPDPFTGSVIQTTTVGSSNCSGGSNYSGQWRSLGTISPSPGEAHVVQVQSRNHSSSSNLGGANNFALRVRPASGSFVACSSDPYETDTALTQAATSISPANCPNVFAFRDLSVYAAAAGSTAEFFLASIGPEHSGKTLVIELYDPGEGGLTLQVTDPNGNVVGPGNSAGVTSFQRSVVRRFASEATPGGGWGPFTEHTVSIQPAGPAPGSGRATDPRCTGQNASNPACRYNERLMRLEIELPDNIDAAYGGRTWWRIRYAFATGVDVTDRTTWSVRVEGGPVRLIE